MYDGMNVIATICQTNTLSCFQIVISFPILGNNSTFINQNTLTSVKGFIRSVTSLAAIDSHQDDGVLCTRRQVVECRACCALWSNDLF